MLVVYNIITYCPNSFKCQVSSMNDYLSTLAVSFSPFFLYSEIIFIFPFDSITAWLNPFTCYHQFNLQKGFSAELKIALLSGLMLLFYMHPAIYVL